jgi:hypothetical protein
MYDGQFTEVFVNGDENSPLGMRPGQDLFVASVRWPVAHPLDVMAIVREIVGDLAPNAGIEEQSHDITVS